MSGWLLALRIARREMLRAKGRSLLVLVMVLLPVTAVVGLSTLLRTSEIDRVEGLPTTLGSASARLDVAGGRVVQDPLLRSQGQYAEPARPTSAEVRELLPEGSRLLEVREAFDAVALDDGDRRRRVSPVAVDLRDPTLRAAFVVLEGRAPASAEEIAVTRELAAGGIGVGEQVQLDGRARTVTGVVQGPREVSPSDAVYGQPAAVGLGDAPVTRYWSSGPPVTWQDVVELNAIGIAVLSRSVVLDPPPADQVEQEAFADGQREVTLAIIGLITVMAVLEVVLLAGPAFAVGARRSRRSLALMAASGAEPAHVRRVVLAHGVLVGVVAVGVGVPLGVLGAALARLPLTRYAGATWGPFDVSWLDLLLVAVLGAGTGVLAALLPALAMSRQPVVAALQGRRVTSAGAGRPALLGLVLIGLGVLLTLLALRGEGPFRAYAEIGVAAGAIPTVLGAVLLAPAVLSLLGRGAARLPLPLRFAVRDADRQRGRTAPAVAAIAATVAGVVALGTAASSDAEQQRREYRPSGPAGVAVVAAHGLELDEAAVRAAAREALPGEPVAALRGIPAPRYSPQGVTEVQVCRATEQPRDGRCYELHSDYSSGYGSELLVGASGLSVLGELLSPTQLASAERALEEGKVLVSSPVLEPGERVELRKTRFEPGPDGGQVFTMLRTVSAQAAPLPVRGDVPTVRAVLPAAVAEELGSATTVSLMVGEDLSRGQESALRSALRSRDETLAVRVERGYESSGDRTVLLVLSLVAGALVLGGTLAATSLALTEARPDLTTLGQVGARPRTRRAVAGGYALVLGLAGAGIGVLAGLVPGVAAAIPLTRGYGSSAPGGAIAPPSYVVDLPWGLLVLVLVVLPLLSAAVAAAATRSGVAAGRRVTA